MKLVNKLARKLVALLLMVSLSLVGILIAPPAAQAAEIAHSFTEVTTNQTTTSTTYVDITGATIASGNFVAGKKYLLLIIAHVTNADVNTLFGIKVLHGTTDFTGSIDEDEPQPAPARFNYGFMDVWTAVSGEGIKLQFRTSAAANATSADQITLVAMNLSDDLTENTDWLFNQNTTVTAASTTFSTANNASVTFTPSAGTDWLVLSNLRQETGGTTSLESRIQSSGTFNETVPLVRPEHENTAGWIVPLLSRVFTSLGAVSQTFTEEFRMTAGTCTTACERLRSAVFALNLNKFKNHGSVWTTSVADLGVADFGTNIATITFTPDAGDVWSGYTWIFDADPDAIGEFFKSRLQVDNADQPPTQTADTYQQALSHDGADLQPAALQSVDNVTAAPHTWDVDASGETALDNAISISLWVVTMELAGGAPPPAGKPIRPPIVIAAQPLRFRESVGLHRSPDIGRAEPPRSGSVWPAVMRWRGKRVRYDARIWTYAPPACWEEEFCSIQP